MIINEEKLENILKLFYPDTDFDGHIDKTDVNYIIRSVENLLAEINTKKSEDRERGHDVGQMNIYDYLENLSQ